MNTVVGADPLREAILGLRRELPDSFRQLFCAGAYRPPSAPGFLFASCPMT